MKGVEYRCFALPAGAASGGPGPEGWGRSPPSPAGRTLGPGVDASVLGVLQVTYTGALLSAGMGHLPFDAVPAAVEELASRSTMGRVVVAIDS